MSDRASTEKLFNRNIETTTNSVARGADENKAGYTAADASGSAFSLLAARMRACAYMCVSVCVCICVCVCVRVLGGGYDEENITLVNRIGQSSNVRSPNNP